MAYENEKFFARTGDFEFPDFPGVAEDARRGILYFDGNCIEGCVFTFEASWFMKPFDEGELMVCDNDVALWMMGFDKTDPENLLGEVEITLDNDVLDITETCGVYIPAGVAHKINVKSVEKPIMFFYCELNGQDTRKPGEATAPAGTYENNVVYRYEPSSGFIPQAPEGFLQLLLWMAEDKIDGAPYLELVRFMCENPTGPEEHSHPKDELIAFIGTDPDDPGDLGGEVTFNLGGEYIPSTKSTVVFVTNNIPHSPILVPKHYRDMVHFSFSAMESKDTVIAQKGTDMSKGK